jgi:MscS family membrane protein
VILIKFNRITKATLLVISLTTGLSCPAQESVETTRVVVPVPVEKVPEDVLNRGTPRGSVLGYMKACASFDYEKAAQYLDLRDLPVNAAQIGGPELARQMNHVLSRATWLDDYSVSDLPGGVKGDDLPDYRDELVRIPTQDGEVVIWMQRVPRGDGERIWKLSNRSVALIPELYAEFSYSKPVEAIRKWFPEDASFLGLEAFKWLIVIVMALLSWPILYVMGRLLTAAFSSPDKEIYPFVRKALTGPFIGIGILIVTIFTIRRLGAGIFAQQVMEARTLVIIVVLWALWAVINLYKQKKQDKLYRLGRPGAAKLMRPIAALTKLVVVIFGVLFWLNNIGVNITTVLAGLGVGGLAIALALQKPLEDMMGALTIFSQATIRVGDFCGCGDITGVVEEIGLRTTRLRTLSDTIVSIPNARIAYVEVENFTAREKIRFWPTLRLRYDTTPDQLQTVTGGILNMLEQDERVHDESLRARLTDFDEDAILIKINSFVKTTDFSEYLEVAEDLNYRIMEIVHAAGARFALPGQSVYMEKQ